MSSPNHVPLGDKAYALAFCISSQVLKRERMKGLAKIFVGQTDVPRGWNYINKPASAWPDEIWSHFPASKDAPRLDIPSQYTEVALPKMQKTEIEAMRKMYKGGRDAVAVRLGEAAAVGALAPGRNFAEDPDDPSLLVAPTRIGRGELIMIGGQYFADGNYFIPAITTTAHGRMPCEAARALYGLSF